MKSDVSSALREKVRKCADEVIRWRHQIHEYPELSFQEFKTSDLIEEKLRSFGITSIRRIGKSKTRVFAEGQFPGGFTICQLSPLDGPTERLVTHQQPICAPHRHASCQGTISGVWNGTGGIFSKILSWNVLEAVRL